jgi:fructosamine-3-kinase
MYNTNTIRVPKPIAVGTSNYNSFVIFEKLSIGGYGDPIVYAKKLAAIHKWTSSTNQYGYSINNTIGATFQPNTWTTSWSDFWDTYRLGHMLQLCKRDGLEFSYENQLRDKVRTILSQHTCVPSLVHVCMIITMI